MPLDKKDEIGALWVRQSKTSGKEFLTGTINGVECVVFSNEYKKAPKEPDYRVYKSQPRTDARPQARQDDADLSAPAEMPF